MTSKLDKILTLIGDDEPVPTQVTHSISIGETYLIRTVTMHYAGRVIQITDSDIVLQDAAWIADTGRYSEALRNGQLSEVEPYPDGDPVIVSRAVIVDLARWNHPLPRKVK